MIKSRPALEISQFLLTSSLSDVSTASPLHLFIVFLGLLRLIACFYNPWNSKICYNMTENSKIEVIWLPATTVWCLQRRTPPLFDFIDVTFDKSD